MSRAGLARCANILVLEANTLVLSQGLYLSRLLTPHLRCTEGSQGGFRLGRFMSCSNDTSSALPARWTGASLDAVRSATYRCGASDDSEARSVRVERPGLHRADSRFFRRKTDPAVKGGQIEVLAALTAPARGRRWADRVQSAPRRAHTGQHRSTVGDLIRRAVRTAYRIPGEYLTRRVNVRHSPKPAVAGNQS
jgi:hypothetical protein